MGQEIVYSKIRKRVCLGHEFFILFSLRSIRPLMAKETGEEVRDMGCRVSLNCRMVV